MLWSCYDHVRRVKNKFMHYRWQPRQCMAGTYCLSLSLHLAGQNFLFKMLAAAIAGIAGPCNSSTSAPSALIFPGLQIRQSPSQSVWRLVQFVHTPLEFTGCILLLAAASPAFHSSCSVCLVLYTLSNKVTCPKSEAFVFPFLVVLPRSVPVILQGDARAASSAGTGLCPAGSANWGRGGSAFRFPPWWPGPNRVEFLDRDDRVQNLKPNLKLAVLQLGDRLRPFMFGLLSSCEYSFEFRLTHSQFLPKAMSACFMMVMLARKYCPPGSPIPEEERHDFVGSKVWRQSWHLVVSW